MKLSSILLSSLLCAASASAQYFSEGWQPGQQQQQPNLAANAPPLHAPPPAQTFDRAAPTDKPAPAPQSLTSLLDINRLLTAGPVASLFGKMGVNITEAVARSAESPWDLRIPFITDENFDEVIVREELTPEEEAERVWFLIISVTAGQNNAISKFVDQSFDEAYNQTVTAGDLPHVRWGRVDYINVTYLTTKWAIWSGPYLVIITDRGQTLRFYKADRVRVTADLLRDLLTEEHWRNTQPWKTNFAPGGKREWILHYYAFGLMHAFNFVNRFPRWMLMIGSGMIASLVMRLLHKSPAEPTKPANPTVAVEDSTAVATSKSAASSTTAASTATSSPSKSSKGSAKSRKGKK
ncbi:uncharacterized protein TRAVEDRAFT_143534 [Trametes versicolor FP-101664 SS1]|uniref:uncharacterized protein n=1 Tax=Trametes versicolor (strain FP-101664) TaxID=717944 RepID=UPI000462234E|nr:uncharacterized protein TRAVEDRAFT_143534 [Trametes versicolor FP-101664 SS1]EIW61597.1 hypothetical protein TRAVEDRAFT_143534 [Trametes versicolor FP-101664 SS1]